MAEMTLKIAFFRLFTQKIAIYGDSCGALVWAAMANGNGLSRGIEMAAWNPLPVRCRPFMCEKSKKYFSFSTKVAILFWNWVTIFTPMESPRPSASTGGTIGGTKCARGRSYEPFCVDF